ncbi:MAG TPA: hypothetical protein VI387_00070, partial [Candidatus Brocadiales bacterium]|nr:hypothetical protein [Candidatus Brocadiales bacterium]
TAEDLWEYANLLKVNLAYSKENLKEILKKYIDVFEPAWGENEALKKIAIDAVGEKMRTPMSVKKLMDYSRDVGTENDLKAGIEKAAKETKIAFANEIKEMFEKNKYDRLVFLSLAYIGIYPKDAEICYEEVLSDLGYSLIKAKTFNDLMEEFREVEMRSGSLRYIHPSYDDAFGFALTDNGKPNNICKKIFSSVLFKLSENDAICRAVASFVTTDLDRLPEDIRNILLLKLSEKDVSAGDVAMAVAENFDKLPEDVRNLLFKLSEKGRAARDVARAVAANFDELPEDVRNKLLLKLSKNYWAAWDVARVVADNFDELPEDVKNLLDKLQRQLKRLIKNSSKWNKISAIRLISNVRTKIDKGFALKILDELSKDLDEKVRAEAMALKSTHPFISS